MALELSGERSALAAQAHGRTVVNLFYEDSTRPKTCSIFTNDEARIRGQPDRSCVR